MGGVKIWDSVPGGEFDEEHDLKGLLNIRFTQKIMHDFAKEFGAVRCKELLGGMDISGSLIPDDEGYAAYRKAKSEGRVPCRQLMRWAIMYPLPSEQEDLNPPL